MKQRKRVALLGAVVLLLFGFVSFAVAEDFRIPKGSLEQALNAYSDVTGKRPVYMNALVKGKESPGVRGNFSSEEAMSKILEGTGLTFTLTHDGNMVIQKSRNSDSSGFHKHNSVPAASMEQEQVVITATKTAIKTKDVPAAVDVVSDEDIKLMPGADSYYEAIKNVAGVNILKDGHNSLIRLRGMEPSMLHDGRDMNPFVTNSSMITNSMNMGMGSVERIEVIKGPQAAIHGSKAVSGVVNVIRKKGDKDNPFAELRGFFGSGDETNGGVSLSGGFNKLAYFLDFSTGKQDEYKTPKGDIPYVDYERKNLFARLDYTFSEDHEITFDYTYNRSENRNGGEGFFYEKSPWNSINSMEPETQAAFLTYNGKFTDFFSLYATLGTGKNEFELIYGRPNVEPIHFLNKENLAFYKENILQGEVRGTMTLLDERLKAIFGLQYKDTDLTGYADTTMAGQKQPRHPYNSEEEYFAPFAQVEFKPNPYLLLVGGVRYDDYDSGGKKMSSTNPNIGLSVFPFASTNYNWTTLWASYSKSFKTPTAAQRYLPAFLGGNPDLEPEEAKGWEIGLKQRIKTWANLEFSYFQTDYTSLIELKGTEPGKWLFLNVGEAKYKGYEALFEVYPTDWLILHFSFSDMDREDILKKRKLTGQPNQTLQYGLTIPDLYGFSFSLWGSQFKELKLWGGDNHPSENDIIWSAKLLYQWNINDKFRLQPFISVENLTDKTHYSRYLPPSIMEERTIQAGATLRMNF